MKGHRWFADNLNVLLHHISACVHLEQRADVLISNTYECGMKAAALRLLSSGLSSQSGFRRQIYRLHVDPL